MFPIFSRSKLPVTDVKQPLTPSSAKPAAAGATAAVTKSDTPKRKPAASSAAAAAASAGDDGSNQAATKRARFAPSSSKPLYGNPPPSVRALRCSALLGAAVSSQ